MQGISFACCIISLAVGVVIAGILFLAITTVAKLFKPGEKWKEKIELYANRVAMTGFVISFLASMAVITRNFVFYGKWW